MKVVVATFNQEKALVGAFSVITNLRMELFQALLCTHPHHHCVSWSPEHPEHAVVVSPVRGLVSHGPVDRRVLVLQHHALLLPVQRREGSQLC